VPDVGSCQVRVRQPLDPDADDYDAAVFVHGLGRVDDQVHHDLPNLHGIGKDLRR
jgi:hypothetical protein